MKKRSKKTAKTTGRPTPPQSSLRGGRLDFLCPMCGGFSTAYFRPRFQTAPQQSVTIKCATCLTLHKISVSIELPSKEAG